MPMMLQVQSSSVALRYGIVSCESSSVVAMMVQRVNVRMCCLKQIVLARQKEIMPKTFMCAIVRIVLSEMPRSDVSKLRLGDRMKSAGIATQGISPRTRIIAWFFDIFIGIL